MGRLLCREERELIALVPMRRSTKATVALQPAEGPIPKAAFKHLSSVPQRLVSLGHPRLFRRLVKSRIDARIGHNSNGLFIFYNDRGFIEVGFVRQVFASERAIRNVMRSIDRRGPPSCAARSPRSVLRRQWCAPVRQVSALRPLFRLVFPIRLDRSEEPAHAFQLVRANASPAALIEAGSVDCASSVGVGVLLIPDNPEQTTAQSHPRNMICKIRKVVA